MHHYSTRNTFRWIIPAPEKLIPSAVLKFRISEHEKKVGLKLPNTTKNTCTLHYLLLFLILYYLLWATYCLIYFRFLIIPPALTLSFYPKLKKKKNPFTNFKIPFCYPSTKRETLNRRESHCRLQPDEPFFPNPQTPSRLKTPHVLYRVPCIQKPLKLKNLVIQHR